MKCENCGSEKSQVLETRSDSQTKTEYKPNDIGTIWRRRKCKACGFSWNTSEIRQNDLDNIDYQSAYAELERKVNQTIADLKKSLKKAKPDV